MGRLTSVTEIKQAGMVDWYFEFGGKYPEHDPAFALECAIDQKHFRNSENSNKQARQIEIRKFIEQSLPDTVIVDYLTLSYYYHAWPGEPDYIEREIKHGYYRFFFESETSQALFALRFSELVSEKLRWCDDQVPHGYDHLTRIWEPKPDRGY